MSFVYKPAWSQRGGGVVAGISRNVKKTVGEGGVAGESFSNTDPTFASKSSEERCSLRRINIYYRLQ